MKDTRGQMLLLSALVVCAFLITLATILQPLYVFDSTDDTALSREAFDNVVWTQDTGLRQIADETGRYPWEERTALVGSYTSRVLLAVSSIEESMLAGGITCSFAFNQSMASDYLEDNGMRPYESINGIMVMKEGNTARVYGCAYDLSLTDGSRTYSVSTVKARA